MRILCVALLMASCLWLGCATTGSKQCCEASGPRIKHVVLFKFKDTAKPEEVEKVCAAFADLQNKVPGIVHYEAGTNVSPEPHSKGLTHAFVLTFKNAAARDAYLPHPDHKAFGTLLGPILADVCVVDYEVK